MAMLFMIEPPELFVKPVLGFESDSDDLGRLPLPATFQGTTHQGGPVATGVYFYRIEAGTFRMTKKMVLLK